MTTTTTPTTDPNASYGEIITARLNQNQPLLNILTGGIHYWANLGRKGLTRVKTAIAFNEQTGLLKPVAVILQGEEKPTYEAIHAPTGYMSTETPVYVFIYDNGDTGYGRIRAAYSIIYGLVHNQPIAGGFQTLWKSAITDKREPDLKDAAFYRIEFCAYGFRSAT